MNENVENKLIEFIEKYNQQDVHSFLNQIKFIIMSVDFNDLLSFYLRNEFNSYPSYTSVIWVGTVNAL